MTFRRASECRLRLRRASPSYSPSGPNRESSSVAFSWAFKPLASKFEACQVEIEKAKIESEGYFTLPTTGGMPTEVPYSSTHSPRGNFAFTDPAA